MKTSIIGFTPSTICPKSGQVLEVSGTNKISLQGGKMSEQIIGILGLNDRIDGIMSRLKNLNRGDLIKLLGSVESHNDSQKYLYMLHETVFRYLCDSYNQEKTAFKDVAFACSLERTSSLTKKAMKKMLIRSIISGRGELASRFLYTGCDQDIEIFFKQFDATCKDKMTQMKKGGKSCPAIYCENWKEFIDEAYDFLETTYYPTLHHFLAKQDLYEEDISNFGLTMRAYCGIDS